MLLLAGSAMGASTPQWTEHETEVIESCSEISQLRNPKPAGKVIEFDERAGVSAVVITGLYPQTHPRSQRGQVLCLFNRLTRTPFIADAEELMGKIR
jgi:hypothetical protein